MNHAEQQKRSTVPVSEEVRDFYERMPYPPPLTRLNDQGDLHGDPLRRRAQFHLTWPVDKFRGDLQILVAGCGTSQAARYALREPDAHVTAIDISEASLRYTRDLQRKHDLNNLELHNLPIERAEELGRSFDLIICTGVLHHLRDPDAGLKALRFILNPNGAMRVMVYAPYGRAGIYVMQKYCRMLGIGNSEEELRKLRATLDGLPADHPISGLLRRAKDFRTSEAMADALLHPLDRAYTVPEVYSWLDRCGLSFGRWIEQAPYLPECGVVANSPHAARIASLPLPLQHAAVELFRGTMVTHSFIAYRDDRRGESQPITFAGDDWRRYIPLPMPWTMSVRERLPPGSVAVLINRAHRFTDLVLSINSFENRLFGAIDGKKTIAEIMAANSVVDESQRRASNFFERLWQYDHIVFDASRAV